MSPPSVQDIVGHVEQLKETDSTTGLPDNLPSGFTVESFKDVKHVSKPWGFELWLASDAELPYALKMIYIKQGTKTSLQYHDEKVEHNVVFAGEMRLHYEDKDTKEIVSCACPAGSVVAVRPPTVHRVEAVTDVFLVEVSTNHLDDVVRIDDDYKRPDGKIESEHQPAAGKLLF